MNNESLNKIWSFLGLSAFILGVNGYLLTQGAHFIIDFGLAIESSSGRYIAAVYSYVLTSVPFLMFLLVTHTYIYKNREKSWVLKIPPAFNIGYNNISLDFKLYQIGFLFLFVVLTASSAFHTYDKFLNGTAYKVKDENGVDLTEIIKITHNKRDHLLNSAWGLTGERYKYQCNPDITKYCNDGISYYPVAQGWFGLVILTLNLLLAIDSLFGIFTKWHLLGWIYRRQKEYSL